MIRRSFLEICLFALVAGCASTFPQRDPSISAASQSYRIPPKQLLEQVKQIISEPPLSIGVEQEQDGSILTGYQRFPGDWHIGRRWQERTRYRITVIPDWNEPTSASRLEVREFTQERAAEGMKWSDNTELQRSERGKGLIQVLDAKLRDGARSPQPAK